MLLRFDGSPVDPGSMEGVWFSGMKLVDGLAGLLYSCLAMHSSYTAAVAELTVNFTQQLLQSGGCHCC